MRVASRFAIGVHILSLLDIATEESNTSEWIAGSIGVNPVIVRNVTGMLRRAGLVTTRQGVAGIRLAKPLDTVTLLDVYHAVEAVDEGDLSSSPFTPRRARIAWSAPIFRQPWKLSSATRSGSWKRASPKRRSPRWSTSSGSRRHSATLTI